MEIATDNARISLRNDYSEGAHPRLLQALAVASAEINRGYGLDVHSARAAALMANSSEQDMAAPDQQRDDARARRAAEVRALAEKQKQQAAEREQQQERGRDDDNDNTPEVSR